MSINWLLDVDPAPTILVLPRAAESLDEAHAAIELWEHYKRRTLDQTQRLVVEVMMATRSDGLWAAQTTGREMPRQNGKGDEVEVVELWGLVQRAERILHTVHDAVLLATETQSRMLSVIDGHADLRRLKARAWRGTGQQMIEMRNGGIIWYRTRTGGGARGVDEVDRIVVDEAQHAEEAHLEAVTPTQLAAANPQLNALGTSGLADKSAWWWQQRKRALSDEPGEFGYVGHTAEDVRLDGERVVRTRVDVRDRANWRRANPVLIRQPEKVTFFEEQLKVLGPAGFAREHLGVWDPEPGPNEWAIPDDLWQDCLDDASSIEGRPVFALDTTPDRAWTSIAVAGKRPDGLGHIEVVDHRAGTHWVVKRISELVASWGKHPVTLDPSSAAGSLIAELERAGVGVEVVTAREHAQACGQLYDAVSNKTVRHIGQASLTAAVAGASKRPVGDAWAWSRQNSSVDISPLVACTLALSASQTTKPEPVPLVAWR